MILVIPLRSRFSLPVFNQSINRIKTRKLKRDLKGITKIILPYFEKNKLDVEGKKVLDEAGIAHLIVNKDNLVIEEKEAKCLGLHLNIFTQEQLLNISFSDLDTEGQTALDIINKVSSVRLRDKAGTFIGARMGRPEKAKMREMTGSPQVMFPVGEEGDRLRSFQSAMKTGKIKSMFPAFFCSSCQKETIYSRCETCSSETQKRYYCRICGLCEQTTCRHGEGKPYRITDIDISYYFSKALKMLSEPAPELLKGIRGTSNKNHLVEHLAKGILRAKHNIYVNKDGTTRYDGTELPLTHFKPQEVKTSLEKLRELGYLKDMEGEDLTDENQILELKPQDVIVPGFESFESSGPKVLNRIANFVDDLLVKFYKQEPFYNIKKSEDLVGQLVIGLAPHISAGMIGRIIGFYETQGLITSPMYHAGLRRDCDGDEACVILLMDALLNFSRQYLPERR